MGRAVAGSRGIRRVALVAFAAAILLAPISAAQATTAIPEPTFTISKNDKNYWFFSYTGHGNTYQFCADQNDDPSTESGCNPEFSGADGEFTFLPVTSGTTYEVCGYERDPSNAIIPDSTACSTTTIDDSIPTATPMIDSGAAYTNSPVMHLAISYADAVSEPWPGASTFDCWNTAPGTCQTALSSLGSTQPDAACSNPAVNNTTAFRSTTITCDYDISRLAGFADGRWSYCVREADSAVPDNQLTLGEVDGTPQQANVSPTACASIILDRDPPMVTPSASSSSVTVGNSVTFGVKASDTASGTSGTYDWDFGDGSAHGSGTAPTHTYAKAGVYTVTVTTRDGAGNVGTGTQTITVTTGGSEDTGKKKPAGRINSTMVWATRPHHSKVAIQQLDVLRAPVGGTVAVGCRGTGCPFARHTTKVKAQKVCHRVKGKRKCATPKTTTVHLAGLFHGHQLKFGTKVTIDIRRTNWIGKVYVFRMSRALAPSIDCLAPGSKTPGKGC